MAESTQICVKLAHHKFVLNFAHKMTLEYEECSNFIVKLLDFLFAQDSLISLWIWTVFAQFILLCFKIQIGQINAAIQHEVLLCLPIVCSYQDCETNSKYSFENLFWSGIFVKKAWVSWERYWTVRYLTTTSQS